MKKSKKGATGEDASYPMRINRYLYLHNICSRRQADRFIEKGLVRVNDHTAVLGEKVQRNDVVTMAASVEKIASEYIYLAYHKPRDVVSHNPKKGEKGLGDVLLLPKNWRDKKLAPLGRLDKASTGLMILSDDGRIVNRLLSPNSAHEKEYLVGTDKRITGTFLRGMERGVNIEGYHTKPAQAEEVNEKMFTLILTEGKKHQIRRMCAALGYQVRSLKRMRIKNIRLGKLKENEYREILGKEKEKFLEGLL